MKNLVVVSEIVHPFLGEGLIYSGHNIATEDDVGVTSEASESAAEKCAQNDSKNDTPVTLTSVCNNLASLGLIVLASNGVLLQCQNSEFGDRLECSEPSVSLNEYLQNENDEEEATINDKVPAVDNSWFHVAFIAETNSVVCISHQGNIVRIQRSGDIDHEGCVDGGIGCVGWSPDQTLLIVATRNGTILAMSNTCDVVQEIPIMTLQPDCEMSLSWCETGEHFALSTVDNDDGVARIRIYNKDLELVSTARNIADGAAMTIKGISSNTVAFANNGSLVAFPLERIKGKYQIAFTEKNGLRHGEFDLIVPTHMTNVAWRVSSVHWDLSTTLLAVGFHQSALTAEESLSYVQIYCRGNYHWYLKQQFSGVGLSCLGFDAEVSSKLYMTQCGSLVETGSLAPAIRIVEFAWDVTRSMTPESSVAVVDGYQILLTSLGICNVPPPMSQYQVKLSRPCNFSNFWLVPRHWQPENHSVWGMSCLCDGNILSVIMGDKNGGPLAQIDYDISPVIQQLCGQESTNPLLSYHRGLLLRSVTTVPVQHSPDILKCVFIGHSLNATDQSRNESDVVVVAVLDCKSASVVSCYLKYGFEGTVGRVEPWSLVDDESVAVGVNTSSSFQVQQVGLGNSDLVEMADVLNAIDIPERCDHFAVIRNYVTVSDVSSSDGDFAVLGLSSKHRLYCGDTLVKAGVTSFAVNILLNMILFITLGTRPQLHFMSSDAVVELANTYQSIEDANTVNLEYADPRPVERGARLVTTVSGEAKVIIQLSRGNLETFEPRPLVLMQARQLLDKNQIFECVVFLRRQKVDINFVVDYDCQRFLDNAKRFVEDSMAKNADILSLFLSSLEPNVNSLVKYPYASSKLISTVTQGAAQLEAPHQPLNGNDKVNVVCEAIRAELSRLWQASSNSGCAPSLATLNPILCTFAKQRPPLLYEGLALISQRFCSSVTSTMSSRVSQLASSKVSSAIKYLLFLADGVDVFNAALGSGGYFNVSVLIFYVLCLFKVSVISIWPVQ
jgi:elongator complex protein 1